MSGLQEQLERLRSHNAAVRRHDRALDEESADLGRATALEGLEGARHLEGEVGLESIVMRRTRPVLAIRNGSTELDFANALDSDVWKGRLTKARPVLDAAIRAVGRIELRGNPDFAWVGTAWLVAPGILVTNRHVALAFATRGGDDWMFKVGVDGPMGASVDFLQEIGREDTALFRLSRVVHVEEAPGPDLSFFAVELEQGDELATPIPLSPDPVTTPRVATIGYPAYDSRIPEPNLMRTIYGDVYDKKRLAPGAVTRVESARLLHNCTTLGGNSGSVVIDLDSGAAVGLHFSGAFLSTNYAVRADVVAQRLAQVQRGALGPGRLARPVPLQAAVASPARSAVGTAVVQKASGGAEDGSVLVSVPLVITVSLGEPSLGGARSRSGVAPGAHEDGGDGVGEAKAADYDNRRGYLENFLGDDFPVPLPVVGRVDDVLSYDNGGVTDTVLRYEHFSVVMSVSRRMCFFSAVNINGARSRKERRTGWRFDARIPSAQQIMKECYGDPPMFSRGHMTRREDPVWGTVASARRGNADSMHVTNATPQMQSFNSPIWLGLEDYALEHAREDDMKISVFTGPYFDESDPLRFDVRVPVRFWKVIAFVHDETGELCATGYEMSQVANLEQPEFVFGDYVSPQLNMATQISIRSIEQRAEIDFGGLAEIDPFADEEVVGGPPPLLAFEQIHFT